MSASPVCLQARGGMQPGSKAQGSAMEGSVLVGSNRRLAATQVVQRVLSAVPVVIVVLVNGLGLEARNRVELLDLRGAEPRQGAEDGALDLGHLGVLHSVHEGILGPRGMLL